MVEIGKVYRYEWSGFTFKILGRHKTHPDMYTVKVMESMYNYTQDVILPLCINDVHKYGVLVPYYDTPLWKVLNGE